MDLDAFHKPLAVKLEPAATKRAALLSRLAAMLAGNADAVRDAASERFDLLEALAQRLGHPLPEASDECASIVSMHCWTVRESALPSPGGAGERNSPTHEPPCPRFWSDPVSCNEFIDSFCDDLELVAAAKRRPTIRLALTERVPALESATLSEQILRSSRAAPLQERLGAQRLADVPGRRGAVIP